MESNAKITRDELDAIIAKIRYVPLSRFIKLVESNSLLKGLDDKTVVSLKTEISRLWTVCDRTIDLRYKVDELETAKVEVAGITHFLDKASLGLLENEIHRYANHYTIGAYEQVKRYFEENKDALATQQQLSTKTIETVDFSQIFERSEERMNLAISCSLYKLNVDIVERDFDPARLVSDQHFEIVTSNISKTALKVRSKVMLKRGDFVAISFDDLEKELLFKQSLITYEVMHCSYNLKLKKFDCALKLADIEKNEEFQKYTKNLIFSHKHKYKVDLDTIYDACIAKGYEQFFVTTTDSFGLFVDDNKTVSQSFGNDHSLENIHLFDVNGKNYSDALLSKMDISNYLSAHPYCYLFVARGKKNDNQQTIFFHCILDGQADNLAAVQRFAKTKGARLFKVTKAQVNRSEAFRTSTIPSEAQQEYGTERIYRSSSKARKLLEKNQSIYNFTPVLNNALDLIDWSTETYSVNPKHVFTPNANNGIDDLRLIKAETLDLRVEDRFALKTKITLFRKGENVSGITIDVSSLGLCVKMEKNLDIKPNTKVEIGFDNFAQRTTLYTLSRCSYYVIGCDRNMLRLSNRGIANHDGREFFTAYIRSKLEELTAIGKENEVYGLNRMLRNVFSSNARNCQLFTSTFKNQLSLSVIANTDQRFSMFGNPVTSEQLAAHIRDWFYDNTINQGLKKLLQEAEQQKSQQVALLVLSIAEKEGIPYIGKMRLLPLEGLDKVELHNAIRVSQVKKRTARVFELKAISAPDEFKRYYSDELSYINRFAKHKYKDLRERITDVKGVIEIVEITDLFHQK
ncbi:hypothetical protein [Aliiglaciecola sp. LCG003]|uniref:hypothetical protein n=1 Tax=Aliiglaciecola sp. LCG003 TaxID=3053655 RepID=UPI0025742F6D|nr:hypothetical protein [Aliiglaciecola sp. LCG003]WJG10341.1 hypothetical protein QR722_04705 [Aliiglaciecola sp. LCG003]